MGKTEETEGDAAVKAVLPCFIKYRI